MNSRCKRGRRGSESNWNRLGEPFASRLGGSFPISDTWLNRKRTRAERRFKGVMG